MDKISVKLTVMFEKPFWVGVFERIDNQQLYVSKVTFGSEPKDSEIYDFILRHYNKLQFSPAVETVVKDIATNPKRRLREARKQTEKTGIGTKSQQALKLQQEQMKDKRKLRIKKQKDILNQRKFQLKQQKRKDKHKGR